MTWQEELRQLDSALAGGELSANEYRKRRDEILAAASSAQPPSPVLGPPADPRPEGEEQDAAEVTQVVNVDNGESEADVTQIISDPAKSNGSEHTQVVTPVSAADGPTSPAMQQSQQPPAWATLPPTQNNQTGIASFPPVPQMGGPTPTPLDAQDLFTSTKPPQGGKKPLLIGLAAVLVLAVAGGAVWFFAFRGDTDDTADNAENPPARSEQSQAPPPEPVDISKIELPGQQAANAGQMDIARASELQVISPSEATLIADAGAQELTYSGYIDGNYRFLLYAYKNDSAEAAKEFTGKIKGVQERLGFTDVAIQGVPEGVTTTTVSNDDAAAVRGVYTYGDLTIQLSVLQIPVGDVVELHSQFQQAMTAVTDAAPPA